jgi:hypothetical protein
MADGGRKGGDRGWSSILAGEPADPEEKAHEEKTVIDSRVVEQLRSDWDRTEGRDPASATIEESTLGPLELGFGDRTDVSPSVPTTDPIPEHNPFSPIEQHAGSAFAESTADGEQRAFEPSPTAINPANQRASPDPLLANPSLPKQAIEEIKRTPTNDEVTDLDLAAKLGLAPQLAKPPPGKADDAKDTDPPPMEPSRSGPGARMVPVPTKGSTSDLPRGLPVALDSSKMVKQITDDLTRQKRAKQAMALARGERSTDDIPRFVQMAETSSKIIPVMIAAFVVFAITMTFVAFFSGSGVTATQHIELRFLPIKDVEPNPYEVPPTITIETEPPGILVILDRRIIGATPITFESPQRGEQIGIELESPYFERWIGEAKRSPTGEMKFVAKLIKKRR